MDTLAPNTHPIGQLHHMDSYDNPKALTNKKLNPTRTTKSVIVLDVKPAISPAPLINPSKIIFMQTMI